MDEMSKEGSQFSLSQQEQTAKGALLENAIDIKVILPFDVYWNILKTLAVHDFFFRLN